MSKRIETKVSITAKGTCLMRATSFYEKDPYYKSEDFIASMIMPHFFKILMKYSFSRTILKKMFFKAPGLYEYVISRTKFIDEIFKNLAENVEQILILGAGFDSRAKRFSNELKNVKIFELDALATQQAKINRFREKSIEFTPNLKFISIDFTKESLAQKLEDAGFQRNRTCLFLLEGLTYYLNQEAINNTFNLIKDYSAQDSLLVFDYASPLTNRQENIDADPTMRKQYEVLAKAGEKPGFLIEEAIRDFLAKYDFTVIDGLDSTELAEKYFNKDDFGLAARKFGIVKAKKV